MDQSGDDTDGVEGADYDADSDLALEDEELFSQGTLGDLQYFDPSVHGSQSVPPTPFGSPLVCVCFFDPLLSFYPSSIIAAPYTGTDTGRLSSRQSDENSASTDSRHPCHRQTNGNYIAPKYTLPF